MSKVILVANLVDNLQYQSECTYIGIDKGALYCVKNNIDMDCAIGDFDSISQEDLLLLKEKASIIQLPVEKDVVDSEYAIKYATDKFDSITLVGVIGGRLDHFMIIYNLLKNKRYNFSIKNEQNYIYRLDKGTHKIVKNSKYISIFACEETTITLEGFKYPLCNKVINENDSFLSSNEIIDEYGKIIISNSIIIVETNE